MGHAFFQETQMRLRMNAQNLLACAKWRRLADKRLKALMLQNPLNHPHTVRPLRVARPHIMGQTIAVREDERIQINVLAWFFKILGQERPFVLF